MATNTTGTSVHVHTEGGGTKVVGPGEEFPEGYEADDSLTGDDSGDESDEEMEVPGPGQEVTPEVAEEQAEQKVEADLRAKTVPQLRQYLDENDVEYSEHDRKDALVEKAQSVSQTGQGSEG